VNIQTTKNNLMKNVFLLLALITLGGFTYGQEGIQYFTKSTAPLNGNETVLDSIYLKQSSIVKISELSGGGSTVVYQDYTGERKSVTVKEQIADSAWTFASFAFTLSGNDTLDSIKVNSVAISGGIVPSAGGTSATASAIADSINGTTSVPNYTATASDSTVTVKPAADSTATPNGLAVQVWYQATASPDQGILTGGFYRRNISTLWGAQNKLTPLNESGVSVDQLMLGTRVIRLSQNSTGALIFYDGDTRNYIQSTDNRVTLQTAINAL
jgi:hypothetical protein